jgi:DNA-binding NtrC family response regulator
METKAMPVMESAELATPWAQPGHGMKTVYQQGGDRPLKSIWADPGAVKSLEDARETLVSTYLAASLNYENIPIKEFMDSIEKQLLLACLGLTQGHQRNAAAVLGLKPTALFEKMRKHCINGRSLKLSRRLALAKPLDAK